VDLEHSETVSGVVGFHRVHGERVPELVRRDMVRFARLRVDQVGQPCLPSASADYLPGAVAVDAEDQILGLISFYKISQHTTGFRVNWDCAQTPAFPGFSDSIQNFSPTLWTEAVTPSKVCAARWAGQAQLSLKMEDSHGASI